MNLVFFTHPSFLPHQSMPRFARMLAEGMEQRGHTVSFLSPHPLFFKMSRSEPVKKWLGYLDQFAVFPRQVRRFLRTCSAETLFVFTDHNLGPWVPLVAQRPTVIHSHDFMAQRSAKGEIHESRTRWTGRCYQQYIRKGYSKGKHFIPISERTKEDLYRFHLHEPVSAEMVYNGLNQAFEPGDEIAAKKKMSNEIKINVEGGYLLHVGGNSWYKNRIGVIKIYAAWRGITKQPLPLLLIGEKPPTALRTACEESGYKADIHFLTATNDDILRTAYTGASLFLFPSLAEGFGWPIAEAMASGCPVVTTAEAPMTEVAGNAGFLIPRQSYGLYKQWANESAGIVEHVLTLSNEERRAAVQAGLENASRFNPEKALDAIERIYLKVLNGYSTA